MKIPKHPLVRLGVAALASAGPIAFPLAQMGYSSLNQLAFWLILPTAVALAIAGLALRRTGMREVALDSTRGAIAGAFATLALEVIRYSGFRAGFMPGNLPELMGVLLLDRFALGPSTASTIAGFAYHFWNGACFGIVFAVLAAGLQRRLAIPYGLAIGLGFLVSPVVQGLGVGLFGKDFGWHFAATVLTAHAAFGATLAATLRIGNYDWNRIPVCSHCAQAPER